MTSPRSAARLLLFGVSGLTLAFQPQAAAGQSDASAFEIADQFQRSLLGLGWYAAAQRMHPDALMDFRDNLVIMVGADRSGEILRRLLGGRSREAFEALPPGEVFPTVLEALERETPGLVNGLVDRTQEMIGTVAEGDELVHAVYRVSPRISGAEPRVEAMTLRQSSGGWKVLKSVQLDAIMTAIRGLRWGGTRTRPPLPVDTLRFVTPVAQDRGVVGAS